MNKGFTLIETLVAIAIMMLAVAGPLTISHRAVMSALYARDQVTASYLAQDAVEYIRSVRDSNVVAGGSWLTAPISLAACLGQNCKIDTVAGTIAACGGSCPALLFDNSNRYQYATGSLSPFTRTIRIDNPVAAGETTDEATVTVTIQWSDSNVATRSFVVKENIMKIF